MKTNRGAFGLLVVALVGGCASGAESEGESTGSEEEALGVTASWDATLRVPSCASLTSSCDSGALARGRGPVGPETNAPNTLYGACADGTFGSFHSDESLDAVKVFTTDSTSFAPGKTATIQATVWAWSGYTYDKLDLYYTADASRPSPVWTFLTTLTPPAAGAQTMAANYTIPAGGSTQAVRAAFRDGGAADPCAAGGYNDRDDLAFVVGSSSPDTTAPTTALTSPASGATVSGTVTLGASAADDVVVTKVEFYADGRLLGAATGLPYTSVWDSASEAVGPHTMSTKAYDAAGNVGVSTPVTVTVAIAPPSVMVNGGFEGSAAPWSLTNGATWSTTQPSHAGSGHVVLHPMEGHGVTGVSQVVTVPATGGTMTFWVSTARVGVQNSPSDTFQVSVQPTEGGNSAGFAYAGPTVSGYVQKTIDLSAFAGKSVSIAFQGVSFSDWSAFDPTWGVFFDVDDVELH